MLLQPLRLLANYLVNRDRCSVIALLLTPEVTLANDLNQVLVDLIQEPLVQHFRVNGFFLLRFAFTRGRCDLDIVNRLDLHVLSKPVLVVEHFEGHVTSASIRVAVLESRVRNKLRNVLFELGQVLRDISLGEGRVLIVRLLLSDAWVKVGLLEVEHQVLAQQLHLRKLLLLIVDLESKSDDSFPHILVVFCHVLALFDKLVVV